MNFITTHEANYIITIAQMGRARLTAFIQDFPTSKEKSWDLDPALTPNLALLTFYVKLPPKQ